MYYSRIAEKLISEYLKIFPVICVMGPRQSGKSTMLIKLLGEKYTYITFDDFEMKELFFNDPKKFINRYSNELIFDEAQYMPAFHKTLEKFDFGSLNKFVVYQGKTNKVIESVQAWNYSEFLTNNIP